MSLLQMSDDQLTERPGSHDLKTIIRIRTITTHTARKQGSLYKIYCIFIT